MGTLKRLLKFMGADREGLERGLWILFLTMFDRPVVKIPLDYRRQAR